MKFIALVMVGISINTGLNAMPVADKSSVELRQVLIVPSDAIQGSPREALLAMRKKKIQDLTLEELVTRTRAAELLDEKYKAEKKVITEQLETEQNKIKQAKASGSNDQSLGAIILSEQEIERLNKERVDLNNNDFENDEEIEKLRQEKEDRTYHATLAHYNCLERWWNSRSKYRCHSNCTNREVVLGTGGALLVLGAVVSVMVVPFIMVGDPTSCANLDNC